MSRALALGVLVVFVASAAAQNPGYTDKTVKIRSDTRLGTKQAGGLLRNGAELRRGQAFTVKSDDGTYVELAGRDGFLFKAEVELFVGREMPKKDAKGPKAGAKGLWAEGARVLGKRSNSQIQFGDRDADGRQVFYDLSGLSMTVVRDNGDGWVRIRDRYHEGWVSKDDFVTREEALDHYDKLVKANPRNSWALFMRAASHHEQEKFDGAIKDYTEYLKLVPNSQAALNNRGNAWMSKKDYDKAIEDYTATLKADPKYALGYSNRGKAWLNKKKYDKAIEDCDESINLDPKYGAPHVYRAQALAKLGKFEEAARGFAAAVKLEPTAARYNSQAWFLATCPDEKYRDGKKAVELANKAIDLAGKGENWVYRDTLAAALAETGEFEKAAAEQQKALDDKDLKDKDQRKKMETRLELYKKNKPHRDEE